jgi:uncharacterized membrane protein
LYASRAAFLQVLRIAAAYIPFLFIQFVPINENPYYLTQGLTQNEQEKERIMVIAAKTASQLGLHTGVAFGTMYLFTGSLALGGAAAVLEPICNVILMPLHDKLWERIRQRIEARKNGKTRASSALANMDMAHI